MNEIKETFFWKVQSAIYPPMPPCSRTNAAALPPLVTLLSPVISAYAISFAKSTSSPNFPDDLVSFQKCRIHDSVGKRGMQKLHLTLEQVLIMSYPVNG